MSVNAIGPAPLPEKSEPVALTVAPYVAPTAASSTAGKTPVTAFDKPDGPSFSDLIDVLNPLQHIPVVNMVYQKLTGDTEGAVADVVGGAIYGGFIGLGAAVAGLMVHEATGRTLGDNIVAMFTDDSSSTAIAKTDSKTQTAQAAKPRTTAAAEPPPVPASPLPAVAKTSLNTSTPANTPAASATGVAIGDQGPVRAGDYLIFGGAGAAAVAIPTASSNRPVALTPTPAATSSAATSATPAAASPGPGRNGDFLVFGSNAGPMPTALPGDEALDPKAETAAAVSRQLQQASAGDGQAPMHPVPARLGKSAPPAVLAMPTTGPGALPGGRSQALYTGNGAGASATPPDGATTSGNANGWFAGAFSQAMDKYQRASRLNGDASQPTPPPAASTLN